MRKQGIAATMEGYARWHKEGAEPSDELKAGIEQRTAELREKKRIEGLPLPQGERYGRLLTHRNGGYRRGRTGISIT